MPNHERGARVDVLYVLRRNAKTVKVALEKEGLLHKQYRMTQPTPNSLQDSCIAIPVTKECLEMAGDWISKVESTGRQYCPYSSAFMGNNRNKQANIASSSDLATQVQKALLAALSQCSPEKISPDLNNEIVQRIKDLPLVICPKKLEVIGDDRTLVIPRRAFREDVLRSLVVGNDEEFSNWESFWKHFATFMESPRVVRRGDIDPDSHIRESGHRLLWPHSGQPNETGAFTSGECAMIRYELF